VGCTPVDTVIRLTCSGSCTLIRLFIEADWQAELFVLLGTPSEVISPSQSTLLKILNPSIPHPDTSRRTVIAPNPSPNHFVLPSFHRLLTYIRDSLNSGTDDPRLAKVLEGAVLHGNILCVISLNVQERLDKRHEKKNIGGDWIMVQEMKSKDESIGVVKPIIGLSLQCPDDNLTSLIKFRGFTSYCQAFPPSKTTIPLSFTFGGKYTFWIISSSTSSRIGYQNGSYESLEYTHL
jgi:hypothetical protein